MEDAAIAGENGKGPRCPVCGWTDVRRSMPKGILDALIRIVGLVPYRCRSCNQRFYRPQYGVDPAREFNRDTPPPPAS